MHLKPLKIVCHLLACCVLTLLTGCSDKNEFEQLPIDAQIDSGLGSLRIFDFESAYEILSHAQPKLSTSSDQWEVATYALGLAAWHKAPPSEEAVLEAKSVFESVVKHAPESNYAASALLDLGRIAEISDYLGEATDVPTAQTYYKKVREQFPNSEMSVRATLFLAQSMAQSFEKDQIRAAVELLDDEMAAQPDSPWLGTMAQFQAQLHAYYLDDYKAALEPYEVAMQVGFPRSAASDASLWQYGILAETAGDYRVAARVLSRLVKNYPRSIYGTVARERVIRIAEAHPEADIPIPELPNIGLGR